MCHHPLLCEIFAKNLPTTLPTQLQGEREKLIAMYPGETKKNGEPKNKAHLEAWIKQNKPHLVYHTKCSHTCCRPSHLVTMYPAFNNMNTSLNQFFRYSRGWNAETSMEIRRRGSISFLGEQQEKVLMKLQIEQQEQRIEQQNNT